MLPVEEIPTIFSDIEPIPQDDGPSSSEAAVCTISYPRHFVIAYDYMRAIWKCKEYSDRALRLTTLCLQLNPANYTVWHYRRQILKQLELYSSKESIEGDLLLASKLGGDNPKNYQIWYHRRSLLEGCGESDKELFKFFVDKELNYIGDVLNEDGKNYHAWSHRQWIIATMNDDKLWKSELEYAHKLIQKDIRNNSAWNQRWFASHRGGVGMNAATCLSLDTAREECEFAVSHGILLDPFNESPYRYLIGIIKEQRGNGEVSHEEYYAFVDEGLESINPSIIQGVLEQGNVMQDNVNSCFNWTSARIDLLELKGDPTSLELAIPLAEELATEYDPIRRKYWMFRMEQMKRKLSG